MFIYDEQTTNYRCTIYNSYVAVEYDNTRNTYNFNEINAIFLRICTNNSCIFKLPLQDIILKTFIKKKTVRKNLTSTPPCIRHRDRGVLRAFI